MPEASSPGRRTPAARPRKRSASNRLAPLVAAFGLAAATACPVLAAESEPAAIPLSWGLQSDREPLAAGQPRLVLSAGIEAPKQYSNDIPASWVAAQADKGMGSGASSSRASPSSPASPQRDGSSPEIQAQKSYAIPALEIVGFDTLLNLFNRAYFSGNDYDSNPSSIKRNLRRSWVYDNDPYSINQLGHPYQGSMYHGFARSAGLNYWESLGYTFAGSAFWEIAGETTPASKNDQITTGIGGSFLGEALYRMSNLVLEQGGGMPRQWRELAAAAISPSTGFNRLAFGNRFDTIFSSRNAPYYSRLAVGVSGTAQNQQGTSTQVKRNEGILDFSLDYGMPGKPGYVYTRPFDYFSFQATAATANGFENLMTRGLLVGKDYGGTSRLRGVWGLYGSYDYFAPQIFRVSSTALSMGTTAEWRVAPEVAIQGSFLVGAGYASVGTINGLRDQDYHNGVAPQGLLALRMIFSNRASLDLTGREYFVSGVAADRSGRGGHDNIARVESALTVRIHKQHAIAIKYLWSHRDASYPVIGDRSQTRGTVGIFYTLLGHDHFGAMDWN